MLSLSPRPMPFTASGRGEGTAWSHPSGIGGGGGGTLSVWGGGGIWSGNIWIGGVRSGGLARGGVAGGHVAGASGGGDPPTQYSRSKKLGAEGEGGGGARGLAGPSSPMAALRYLLPLSGSLLAMVGGRCDCGGVFVGRLPLLALCGFEQTFAGGRGKEADLSGVA